MLDLFVVSNPANFANHLKISEFYDRFFVFCLCDFVWLKCYVLNKSSMVLFDRCISMFFDVCKCEVAYVRAHENVSIETQKYAHRKMVEMCRLMFFINCLAQLVGPNEHDSLSKIFSNHKYKPKTQQIHQNLGPYRNSNKGTAKHVSHENNCVGSFRMVSKGFVQFVIPPRNPPKKHTDRFCRKKRTYKNINK